MSAMFTPLLDSTVLFARGGAGAHVPANTIESFELGLRLGASGLDGDIWLTADGQAVFNYGGVVGSRLRRKPIGTVARDALPTPAVDVAQLVDACGTGFELSIEIRDPGSFDAVVSAAESAGIPDRLWITHSDVETLARWRTENPHIRFIHSTRMADLPKGPEQHAAHLRERSISGVSFPYAEWTAGHVALFHRFTRLTVGWMPEHERHIRELMEMGIDAVISEHVERMSDAARSLG